MNYFLGVDAGGTKTEFLLGTEHEEIARTRVGSIKRMRVSAEEAEANLLQALAELERQSGVKAFEITHTCIGAAGSTVPLVTDWMRSAFGQFVGGQLTITNDVEIALDAAFQGGRGVLALAGTGANFSARTRAGELLRAGGWGPALGDEGSGYWIGAFGLRRAFRALDEGRQSSMMTSALRYWQLDAPRDLIAYVHQQPPPDVSRLAPLFAACAAEGDRDAQDLLTEGGQLLARSTALLIERMAVQEAPAAFVVPDVACIGSVLAHVLPVRAAFEEALQQRYAGIRILAEPADAAAGALWRAQNAARTQVA